MPVANINPVFSLAVALLAVIAASIAGWIVVRRVRAWANEEILTEPFTLQDLRMMRDNGEITPDEYETMRDALLNRVKASLDNESDAGQRPPDSPPDAG